MAVAISLPFRFNESGAVDTTNSDPKIWSNRVISAILTRPTERLMRPEYGSRVMEAIFENEMEAITVAQREVTAVFSRWLQDLSLLSVTAKVEQGELAENTLVLSVEYLLPNKQKNITTTRTRLGSFTSTGLLIEEIQ